MFSQKFTDELRLRLFLLKQALTTQKKT